MINAGRWITTVEMAQSQALLTQEVQVVNDAVRRIQLLNDAEPQDVDQWKLVELDESGNVLGEEQRAWEWSFAFSATSVSTEFRTYVQEARNSGRNGIRQSAEIRHHQMITAELRSAHPWDDMHQGEATSFRMFGADGKIARIGLEIWALEDEGESEVCWAVGETAFVAEVDWVKRSFSDWVVFSLKVKPSTFSDYLKVVAGGIDRLELTVGRVSGFYAQWAPSISTDNVKVLANQHVESSSNPELQPPRLGPVGRAELKIVAKNILAEKDLEVEDPLPDQEPLENVRDEVTPDPVPGQILESIRSLKRWVVWLLVILVIVVGLT